jgi:hypothetical protein
MLSLSYRAKKRNGTDQEANARTYNMSDKAKTVSKRVKLVNVSFFIIAMTNMLLTTLKQDSYHYGSLEQEQIKSKFLQKLPTFDICGQTPHKINSVVYPFVIITIICLKN